MTQIQLDNEVGQILDPDRNMSLQRLNTVFWCLMKNTVEIDALIARNSFGISVQVAEQLKRVPISKLVDVASAFKNVITFEFQCDDWNVFNCDQDPYAEFEKAGSIITKTDIERQVERLIAEYVNGAYNALRANPGQSKISVIHQFGIGDELLNLFESDNNDIGQIVELAIKNWKKIKVRTKLNNELLSAALDEANDGSQTKLMLVTQLITRGV